MRIHPEATRALLLVASLAVAMLPALQAQSPVTDGKSAEYPVGGMHEFGAYIGHSWDSGPQLGFVRNTKYTTVVARYSYRIHKSDVWNLRYAPEITLVANLYEPAPSPDDIHTSVPARNLGGGISPLAFQGVFLPRRHIQPFVSADGGMLYYDQPVLANGGTAFMFTIDYGAGMNIFVHPRYATTIGFRYQHQSNADVGKHNPGTDAELFYVGFSHFHTKGVH